MTERIVSIRGAVTASNTKESIAQSTRRLIEKMYFKNGLSDADVVNITFSLTADLTAAYPARTVRETGHIVPLFSCVEPSIDGAISGCIRAMITAYSKVPAHNVYLNGARALRPDITDVYAIALDGPSGAGKSTVAKLVAKKLGITYLDTGALYRALGLTVLDSGISPTDEKGVKARLENVNVGIEYRDGSQCVYVDGVDVSSRIRTPEVSMAASAVSAIPYVREKLLDIQRDISKRSSVILDGRDIGTVVLPDAEFKYFLTASAKIRAKRRFDELIAKGEKVEYENVLNDVITRDKNDSSRKIAPLKKAFDAKAIVSDELTAEEVAKIITDEVTEDTRYEK